MMAVCLRYSARDEHVGSGPIACLIGMKLD